VPVIGRRLALLAYESAAVGPDDIDLCEVHDATSFGEQAPRTAIGLKL
jgi:acetyl-CoA acyltransferase